MTLSLSQPTIGVWAFVLAALSVMHPRISHGCPQTPSKLVTSIEVSGLHYTKEYVVLRELVSQVGEPFAQEHLAIDAQRLDRLGIFSAIDVTHIEGADGVSVLVTVKETFPYLPTVSIEINDENGLSMGPGFRSVNFLGRDIDVAASARFGGATNAQFFVQNPWVYGNHGSYQVQAFRRDRINELDGYQELATELDVALGSYIGWRGRVGGLFRFRRTTSDLDGVTLSPDNTDNTPGLGFYIGYDSRDLWSNTQRGWWLSFDVLKNGGALGGDGDYWTFNVDPRRYQPLSDRMTLAMFSFLTLQTGELGTDIPIHQDFHIGGANTIRGWQLDSQSGKNQFINTVELRYNVLQPRAISVSSMNAYLGVQVGPFIDFGQAWNQPEQFGISQFLTGYGATVRIILPFLEVVRMDFAWGEPGQGMTFRLGVFEKADQQRARVR